MSADLHIKYRPKRLDDVLGQDKAVAVIKKLLDSARFPSCMMFEGPSGTGKTTIAYILKDRLGCAEGDFVEINCAAKNGPDMIRDIPDGVRLTPIGGRHRVWFLEEIQSLSRAGFAQQSLLKVLEEGRPTAKFLMATTDSAKVIKAIRTRCVVVNFEPVPKDDLIALVNDVCSKEEREVSEEVAETIADTADGSPRQALVLLGVALSHDDEADQLRLVKADLKRQSYDLLKLLLWEKPPPWEKVAAVLRDLKGQEEEQVRRYVLASAANEMLKGGKNSKRAYLVAKVFQYPTYDSGFPGLVAMAYEVLGPP